MNTRGGRSGRWLRTMALLLVVAAVLYVAGFMAYGVTAGADEYLAGSPKETACATPGSRFGWAYEAINYDIADDEALLDRNDDPEDCGDQGAGAGEEVVSNDGVRIAGWFIPAAVERDVRLPVVLIVHGGKSNKSGMLDYAPPFHEANDIVIIDLRNSGRSDAAFSTGGLYEQRDIEAMLEWLGEHKAVTSAVLVGNSNGAAASLAAGITLPQVRALVLDSMHATVERQIGNVIQTERHLPAWPGAWAVVRGVSYRLGESIESVDPVRLLPRWDDRPILFTHGSADVVDRPADSLELNLAAAEAAGLSYESHVCEGAGHGRVVEVCEDAWTGWVQTFVAAVAR
jgi:pimeloyl-ACP methyl ester carboxylesterase